MSANNNIESPVSGGGSTHTTFVQADPSTFRALVQKLTGATEDPSMEKLPVTTTVPTRNKGDMGPRKPGFKLQERRHTARKLEIKLGGGGGGSNNNNNNNGSGSGSGSGSPSCGGGGGGRYRFIGGEMVMISPVSHFDFLSRGSPRTPEEEEERAIAEKGFYLHHPSPLSTPRGSEPELLPLFPLQSPRDQQQQSNSS